MISLFVWYASNDMERPNPSGYGTEKAFCRRTPSGLIYGQKTLPRVKYGQKKLPGGSHKTTQKTAVIIIGLISSTS
jgi:hypothetical protein